MSSARIVTWLRSVVVCPCSRCREARREEHDHITPDEAERRIHAMLERGVIAHGTQRSGAQRWREAIERIDRGGYS